MKRRVFYSFHYDLDVFRVQQIRNMGVLESDEPVQPNIWEEVKKKGELAIKRWINNAMSSCSCVIVLIGAETWTRHWIKYEIEHAWETGKGLMGIYIHNLKDINGTFGKKGRDPFSCFQLRPMRSTLLGGTASPTNLSEIIPRKAPTPGHALNDIKEHLASWVEQAIKIRSDHSQTKIEKTPSENIFGESLEDKD